MILCAAVDDNLGMTFNNRRQSQDRELKRHLLGLSLNKRLWMNTYTAKQFENFLPDNVIVDDDFLDKAETEDFCFVENMSVRKYEQQIQKIILFKWNRIYPADTYFDIQLSEDRWKLISVLEFEGNSHKKITKEEWEYKKA